VQAQGLMVVSYNKLHTNLVSLYNQHQYPFNHIKCTSKQISKGTSASKKTSNALYSTIPKSQEWFIINYIINVTSGNLLAFYIFRGEQLQDN